MYFFFQRKTKIHKQSQQPQISPETSQETEAPDNNTENPVIDKYSENSVELESHSGKFYLEVEEI